MRFSLSSRRITIEAPTEATDSMGSTTASWAKLTTVWAERKNMRGTEKEAADQRLAEAETKFTIRYSTTVSAVGTSHRISQGSEYFDILAAIPIKGDRPDRLELYTKRAAA